MNEKASTDHRSLMQKALLELREMRSKLHAIERARHEPIAIVGMGCRFPGGAHDPETFWQLLWEGRDAITEVPAARWALEPYYDPTPATPGKMYTRHGGFVGAVDRFDAEFFGVSPREAVSMDPQQRLLLEVGWEALERAGLGRQQVAGSRTGVFIGITTNDYGHLIMKSGHSTQYDPYVASGNSLHTTAGRLSYVLGVHGPTLAVDTACSSSLVAVHLACQSLRLGECELALAGGVNLMLVPDITIILCQAQMLAPDGRCKTFDARADGYVRGEGCGVVVLKRLAAAQAAGDPILAVIAGSAVNHGGASGGLTVPNGPAQQALLRQALAAAQVAPAVVSYVEAHGTGTALGDPIEMGALGAVFGEGRAPEAPLLVGSVKTNIGHLEAAAGIAGLIKAVLALQHEEIPAHLHFKQPSPYIDWNAFPMMVPTQRTSWPAGARRRIAGISSFGVSGTNAHVVLEEAPIPEPRPVHAERPLHLLTLSGKTEAALKQLAERYVHYFAADPSLPLGDICFSANTGRAHFTHRLSVVAASVNEAREKLAAYTTGQESAAVFRGQIQNARAPKVAFLFTGQGAQYVGMGRELYETQPTFRQALEHCAALLEPELPEPLLSVLYPAPGGASPLDETAYTQPALFALEYALAQLWQAWGVVPDVLLGHSVGEYVAACVAGVFSVEDGLKLVAARGRLMQALPREGAMVAVWAPEARLVAALVPYRAEVALAAVNGPAQGVLAGRRAAVAAVVRELEAEGIRTQPLVVSHAFHSPLMEPMQEALVEVARTVTFQPPRLGLVSTVSGALATAEVSTAAYWGRQVREPVRFAAGMATVQAQGCEVFVEVGPTPTLVGLGRQCVPAGTGVWVPSLARGRAAWATLLHGVGTVYTQGVAVDWRGFDRDYGRRKVAGPTYPFQRQRYWGGSAAAAPRAALRGLATESSPILTLLSQGETQAVVQQLVEAGSVAAADVPGLSQLLDTIVARRHQERVAAALPDWLYHLEWQRTVGPAPLAGPPPPGTWLILADQGGVGAQVATLLTAQGQTCLLAYAGATYAAVAPGVWQLNPAARGDFVQWLREANTTRAQPVRGVLHLWSLDAPVPPTLTLAALEAAQVVGCGSGLHLVQALPQALGAAAPPLWWVTRGAVAVGAPSRPLAVAQAPLWGFGRVVALEHPEWRGGLLDLDPEGSAAEAAQLLAAFQEADGEDQVAIRGGQRYVARLVRSRLPAAPAMSLRAEGTYLITGGLGALGRRVARWLVTHGARCLVLTGRQGATPAVQDSVRELEAAGARVRVMAADVANAAAMERVLAEVQATLPLLRGIVHAAGVAGYEVTTELPLATLLAVSRPKVLGTWVLHQLTAGLALDFFVGFSSIAAVWGSSGQAHYAAANAFLDSVAQERRRLGLPSVSVNWGPWAGGGMVTAEAEAVLARMGIAALPPEVAVAALGPLLAADRAQITLAQVDWRAFKAIYEARGRRPLVSKLAAEGEPSAAAPASAEAAYVRQLAEAPARQRHALLQAHIAASVAQVLGFEAGHPLSAQHGLADLGLDSLLAVELKTRLEGSIGCALPATLAFDYPTIEALTDHLLQDVLGLAEPGAAAPHRPARRAGAAVEPIAIVGMACRLPGGVTDPEGLWQLLWEGRDAITEVPPTRWALEAYYDPTPGTPGKIYTRYGGFVAAVEDFDAAFFGIAPREAVSMDPQQRLLLEVSWEALERAGLGRPQVVGSPTGVFIGVSTQDYGYLLLRGREPMGPYFGTGNALNTLAGRVAYVLGGHGPTLAVDTACSSSLVAVHLACQSLQVGECALALAGGVNLVLVPEGTIATCQARMLAPDGRCKTFDARADGYVRGEGCGVVVLKRLAEAQAAGDPILAVITGSAVNHGGASSGLTVPNGPAQQALLRQALAAAQVAPGAVSYVEAHGTGTALGDPIEMGALGAVFGEGRAPEAPLLVGSVKTNLGHLEAAAGIAGLMKVVVALQHRAIPPHLHLEQPNPHIAWETLPVEVPTVGRPWPAGAAGRVAGVSAFGVSGTNAHVVVREAPAAEPQPCADAERPVHVLTLSAPSAARLQALAERYASHLTTHPEMPVGDVCFTANTGRSHFAHRLAVVGCSALEIGQKLTALPAEDIAQGSRDQVPRTGTPKVAFLFTGQGAQYVGMGRQLYESAPTFRAALDYCDEVLRAELPQSLLTVLYPAPGCPSPLDETAYTQPALFALEYALAQVWQAWGVVPDVVLGHSVGEYVAACVAGVFSLEDGLKLVAARGRLMQALPRDGAMAVVWAPAAHVAATLAPYATEVTLAAVNGPAQVVISGRRQAVDVVRAALEADGFRSRPLTVSHAFHSPLMEPILKDFAHVVREVTFCPPRLGLVANLSGELATEELTTAAYWCRHVREPVQFAAGMATLQQQGCEVFVEVGPQPTLLGLGRQCVGGAGHLWLPSLRPGHANWEVLLQSVGALYVRGGAVDWQGVDRPYPRRKVVLPTYPFQRQRYWVEPAVGPQAAGATPSEQARFSLTRLLNQGDPSQLVQRLAASGKFSAEEAKCLPKLLEVLGEQDQQQLQTDMIKDWLYEIQWHPQLRQGGQPPPDYLPAPSTIQEHLLAQVAHLSSGAGLEGYGVVLRQLEALSTGYVLQAFEHLGWQWDLDQRFSTTSLAKQLGVQDHYQRLLGRLLEILAEDGVLSQAGDAWEVVRLPEPLAPPTLVAALVAAYPRADAELTLLEQCGSNLAEVLRGERDPLQLLFPDGDMSTTARLYRESPGAQVMNTLVQQAVSAALQHIPPGRGVRILEIGAGTGGTTAHLLPHLPAQRTEYVFTDISPTFLTQAQEQFRAFPFVRYHLLDIEQAPQTQGFEAHTYDIIVATNVLHATRDLRQTLHHVQQLLASEGLVVLLEGTSRQRWIDLIFGLTDGWWRFADPDIRPSYPLLTASQWQNLLQESGFQSPVALAPALEREGLGAHQAVLIAQGPQVVWAEASRAPGRWVILADGNGTGEQVAARLRTKGESCVLVFAGTAYEQIGTDAFRMAPTRGGDFQRILQALERTAGPAVRGVVHLWSLDAVDADGLGVDALQTAVEEGCGSALQVVQGLAAADLAEPPWLWLVTRGVQPVGTVTLVSGVAQAPLWGLGRVVTLEHPEWHCVCVDIDAATPGDAAAILVEEIWGGAGEDQVTFRDGVRHVARLVQSSPRESHNVALQAEGTYLITGGLGALGLWVARWLVEAGAKHLVLLGRRGASSQAQEVLTQLEQAGATVLVRQGDVANESDMARVLEEVQAALPPLRGIVHAAGVAGFQAMRDMDLDTLTAVCRPKVLGTWMLHQLTRALALDFFVGFSSAASVWGSQGQAHYAAANHFLDTVAHYRHGLGLPALSVNWGRWAGNSMVTAEGHAWLSKLGMQAMPPRQAVAAMAFLLGAGVPQATVADVDWRRFKEVYEARQQRPLLERIQVRLQEAAVHESVQRHELLQQLTEAPASDRHALLMAYIQDHIAQTLGLSVSQLDVQQPLINVGIDSLMAIELKHRVSTDLGVDVPIVQFLGGGSIATLATQLSEQWRETLASSSASLSTEAPLSLNERHLPQRDLHGGVPPEVACEMLATLDQLSDEEVDDLLRSILSEEGSES